MKNKQTNKQKVSMWYHVAKFSQQSADTCYKYTAYWINVGTGRPPTNTETPGFLLFSLLVQFKTLRLIGPGKVYAMTIHIILPLERSPAVFATCNYTSMMDRYLKCMFASKSRGLRVNLLNPDNLFRINVCACAI